MAFSPPVRKNRKKSKTSFCHKRVIMKYRIRALDLFLYNQYKLSIWFGLRFSKTQNNTNVHTVENMTYKCLVKLMSYFKRKGFSFLVLVLPPPSLSRHFLFFTLEHMRDDGVGRGGGGAGAGAGGGERGGDKKEMETGYICFALAFLVAAILYLIDPNPKSNSNPPPSLSLSLTTHTIAMPKKKGFEYMGPLGSESIGVNVSRCFGNLGVFRVSVTLTLTLTLILILTLTLTYSLTLTLTLTLILILTLTLTLTLNPNPNPN